MPQIEVTIGGRTFELTCEPGQEASVEQAADLLDAEATALQSAIGRVPEPRMLLMSGLMLADRTTELAQKLAAAEEELAELKRTLQAAQTSAAQAAQAEAADQVDARDMAAALDIIRQAADRAEALAGTG